MVRFVKTVGIFALLLMCSWGCYDHGMAAEWEHYAIAVSEDYTRVGCGWGRTHDHAKQEALESCGSNCRVVTWASSYRKECAYLAQGDGTSTGWGSTRQSALDACSRRGSDCHIVCEGCPPHDR
jgi:hypothetical protein